MSTITANTTDEAIALMASTIYFPRSGVSTPPARRTQLVNLCVAWDDMPQGGWPETRQAWLEIEGLAPGITDRQARDIAAAVDAMRRDRNAAQRQQALSLAGKTAKPYQAIVDAVVGASIAAGERPEGDEYYVAAIRAAYPQFDAREIEAISMVCVHRVRREREPFIAI